MEIVLFFLMHGQDHQLWLCHTCVWVPFGDVLWCDRKIRQFTNKLLSLMIVMLSYAIYKVGLACMFHTEHEPGWLC